MVANLFESPSARQAITLRPYQDECLRSIERMQSEGYQRLLAVLFTGAGKTTIFSEYARRKVENGGRLVILAHRDELIRQAADRLWAQCGIRAGVEIGGEKADRTSKVVVASVATVGRSNSDRLDWLKPTDVICDEAHHAAADTYMCAARRFGCYEGDTNYLGVTATPHRMDNRPLHGNETAIFQAVAYDYGITKGILDNWLVDIRAFRSYAGYSLKGIKTTAGDYNQKQLAEVVDNDTDNWQAIKHWKELADGRRTITFCVDVDHARHMAELFQSVGVKAECVHGGTPKEQRDRIIARFRSGETQVLTNCNIATEGFDAPEVSCVLLMRPTQSWSLFTQMVGRGLRLSEGKSDCIVIDVVGIGADKSLATVPEMLGLPKTCDSSGDSMKQTIMAWDELDDWQKARLNGREFDLSRMAGILEEIDLLAELKPPKEVADNSRFMWLVSGPGRYVLQCGGGRDGEDKNRRAILSEDLLGIWNLEILSDSMEYLPRTTIADTDTAALKLADEKVKEIFPSIGALADQTARWRGERPSPRQKELLVKFGYLAEEVDQMTKGDASVALDKIAQSGWKKVQR